MKEISKKRKFKMWLRFSSLAIVVHIAVLVIICATTHNCNPQIPSEISFWVVTTKVPSVLLISSFATSRWLDPLIWPIWFGIIILLFTNKQPEEMQPQEIQFLPDPPLCISLGLSFGAIWGIVFGLTHGVYALLTGCLVSALLGGVILAAFGLVTLIQRLYRKINWAALGHRLVTPGRRLGCWLIAHDTNGNSA